MTKDRMAVVGSRSFKDYLMVERALQSMKDGIKQIVSGGAEGADKLAEEYAAKNKIPIQIYPPDWQGYGKSAAFIRNQQIVDNSDRMVAFWDGKSSGTLDAIKRSVQAGHVTLIVPVGYWSEHWGDKEKK